MPGGGSPMRGGIDSDRSGGELSVIGIAWSAMILAHRDGVTIVLRHAR